MKLKLPNHWVKTTVSELYSEVKDRAMPEDEQLNYIGLEHLKSGGGIEQIGNAKGLKSQKTFFKNGDILYGKLRPYLNKHAIVDFDGVCSTDILVYRASDKTQASWLNYFLGIQEVINHLDSKSKGNSLPRVSPQEVGSLPIPLSPLPEQRRIAAKLDLAMERLGAVEAALEEVPGLLEEFRRSVLHWGVTGRLTEGDNLMENWKLVELKDIIRKDTKISYGVLKPGEHCEDGVPMIKSQHVNRGRVSLDIDHKISRELDKQYSRTRLEGNEVLLTLIGASIGRTAIVPKDLKGANVSRAVAVIKLNESKVKPAWVHYFLTHIMSPEFIEKCAKGSAQPVLNIGFINRVKIPLPTIKTQEEIIQKIEKLLAHIKEVEDTYQKIQKEINLIYHSLLIKAFRGELLTEAELAEVRAEADYEAAGVLLERIREEKGRRGR